MKGLDFMVLGLLPRVVEVAEGEGSTSTGLTNSIYTKEDNKLTQGLTDIIELVGGIGGLIFTLAILIIGICIIFGSISPRNIGTWWKALFSCIGGAVLFFSAYFLSDVLAQIFS